MDVVLPLRLTVLDGRRVTLGLENEESVVVLLLKLLRRVLGVVSLDDAVVRGDRVSLLASLDHMPFYSSDTKT